MLLPLGAGGADPKNVDLESLEFVALPEFNGLIILRFMNMWCCTIIMVFLVTEKVKGNITFTTMNLALVAVEAGMGRFIGEMVEGLFKEKQG